MTTQEPEWLQKLRLRWTQPNPSRFLRPDGHRFIRPDGDRFLRHDHARFDGPQAYDRKYSADQLRVPAGNPDGGQWTSEGGGITGSRILSDKSPDPIRPGAQYAANGHHYVPRSVFENEKYSFRPEILKVFENEITGPLNDPTSNKFDKLHQEYNKAVEETLDRFLDQNKIRGVQMTPDQARSFAQEIKTSRDPRIFQFNKRLWMREIMYWNRRGPRGRE